MKACSITLPWPPSGNHWHRTGGKNRYPAARYVAWRQAATLLLRSAMAPVLGRYAFEIVACPPDRRIRDLDNLLKPVGDALQDTGVIENDHLVSHLQASWGPVRKGGVVFARIRPFAGTASVPAWATAIDSMAIAA